MRIFKPIMKVAVFIAILLILNEVCNFALEPVEGASDVMWSDYMKEENLDMIYTGSSFSLRAFNPYVIDDILGTNSYNMGTPSQAINQTYMAIKAALENHELDTVVLAINFSSLESDWPVAAKVAFYRAKGQNEPFIDRIKDTLWFMLDEDNREECTSINFLFPWIYNHVGIDRYNITKNIKAKVTGVVESNVSENDPESIYVGKGFGYYVGQVDYNSVGNENSFTSYTNVFSTEAFYVIRDIISLCQEKDVELIAVNVPRPVFDVLSYGEEYFEKHERLSREFWENGAEYYDFNFVKPEIMEIKENYFVDMEHLNEQGANQFSASFAKFLQIRDSGEDMSQYFYEPEEYLDTIDYVTNTYFDATSQEDGVLIQANAYHGNGVEVEYEFSLWDADADSYTVLREYDTDSVFLYKTEQEGSYHFCVRARKVGSDVEFERYYKGEVEYSRNIE